MIPLENNKSYNYPIILLHSDLESFKPDPIRLKHILLQHQLKVISGENEEDMQPIHVRRKYIFSDAMRAFCRPTFDVSKMLKVRFISEQAEDEGGPRREFFGHLVKEALQQPTLFVGWPDHVIPVHNIDAVSDNKYYIIGKMIATSIIQGGQSPLCFSAAVADFLVYDSVKSKPCIQDIPDQHVCEALNEVCCGLLFMIILISVCANIMKAFIVGI